MSPVSPRTLGQLKFLVGAALLAGAAIGGFVACGDDDDTGATCSAPGAAVTGAADTHCDGVTPPVVDQAECSPPDAGPGTPDAGEEEPGGDYGDTLFNAEGDDDDCKYHLSWTSTDLCENGDVFFTLTGTVKADGKPMLGADPSIESFLKDNPSHVVPNSNATTVDLGGGKYKIGPIHFDAPGQWVVRFHVYETCADSETSPHGHGAFFVNLP